MKVNVGIIDRVVRVIIGIVIVGAGVFYESAWGAIGLIPVFTAAFGFCPIYVPLGVSTCPVQKAINKAVKGEQ
jgi:hypothetical protein